MSTESNSQISILYDPRKGVPPRTGILALSFSVLGSEESPDSKEPKKQMLWLQPNVPQQLPVKTVKALKTNFPNLWKYSVLSEMGLALPDPQKIMEVDEEYALEVIQNCDSLGLLREYAKFAYKDSLGSAVASRISFLIKGLENIEIPVTNLKTVDISNLKPTEAKKLIEEQDNLSILKTWNSKGNLTSQVEKVLENKIKSIEQTNNL